MKNKAAPTSSKLCIQNIAFAGTGFSGAKTTPLYRKATPGLQASIIGRFARIARVHA